MKKFILHTLLFVSPLMVTAVLLFFQPINKKRAYHCLTNDCEGRGAWMYRRIFERPESIDIAFLGSSHTINGINDTLISRELSTQQITACNLGYCRLGANLNYVLIKHLIEKKKPKTIVIEAMPDETYKSHPIFPYMAEWSDVTPPIGIFSGRYGSNLYDHVVAKWIYARSDIWQEGYPYVYALRAITGFTTNKSKADTNTLNQMRDQRHSIAWKSHTWKRKYAMIYPKSVLANIYTLCKMNQIRLIFLYIPPYGSPEKVPLELETYQKYGDVWLPPDSIFTQKDNWYDADHLNLNGANELSAWVAQKLKN